MIKYQFPNKIRQKAIIFHSHWEQENKNISLISNN